MGKKILLVERNPVLLSKVADALTNEGLLVQTTNRVDEASRIFNGAAFDLVAFGRGVDDATSKQLRADFAAQNSAILFVEGLEPVIPLLVRQINLALSVHSAEENVLMEFGFQWPEILVSVTVACQLKIDLYQLDDVHATQKQTIVAQSIEAGTHLFLANSIPDDRDTINFLAADIDDRELAVITF